MTVQTTTNVASFNGNGVAQIFPIGFKFNRAEDIVAWITDLTTGTATKLTLNSDYTVSGAGDDSGGVINVTSAPATGKQLKVSRIVDLLQLTDLRNQGKFFAEVHEDAFDLLTMIAQQQQEEIDSTLRVAVSDPSPKRLPPIAQRAGRIMAFDENGDPTTAVPVVDSTAELRLELEGSEGSALVGYGTGSVKDALDEALIKEAPPPILPSPLLVEQHVTGFFGRGMLAAEPTNDVGEQNFSSSASVGATTIPVAVTTPFKVGGSLVIRYPSGKYVPHFISAVDAGSLGIIPGLHEAVTSADQVARTWFDTSHPGRFYTRYLAQRVATATGLESNTPDSPRVYFSQYDSNPAAGADVLTPIGTALVNYYDEDNVGSGGINSLPVVRLVGRTAFIDVVAIGDGARTPTFDLPGSLNLHFRALLSTNSADSTVTINLVDNAGAITRIGQLLPGFDNVTPRYRNFLFRTVGNKGPYHVQITNNTAGDRVHVDQLEIFEASSAGRIIDAESSPKIVALGDSWVAGYLEGSIQREPLTNQLAAELPNATIINAGVGGNTVQDLLARFDTDVAPHNPDYVVINTGTNDAANPASGTFFPNAVDFFQKTYAELLGRIQSIGARPIIIGLPALAETQGTSVNWEQNNRARTYSRYLYKNFAQTVTGAVPITLTESSGNADTGYTKYSDGRLEWWVTTTVSMATTNDQTINPPAGASPVGQVRLTASLISLNSGGTPAAWASHTLRGGNPALLNITAAGTSTSETIIVNGVGRWK
ncbi:hypothetical protein MT1_3721 [Pseudomonas sp. MT-1]|uniref:GDSL-type esterase/lipase family protein n=1 Tax=Stutzerimonas stutzeri TaxID=316 RepID=UPI0005363F95|nr:GDSL-type esterase/lipase family protein [Stutzerimonas stutzeri]MCQ4282546.1 GDSL-type esterase/lipase family protein [Stutzerimonas stutzeri]BAP80896.1 hypothetical protein MT1_3721 [Pseudomonas sp. MT-1]